MLSFDDIGDIEDHMIQIQCPVNDLVRAGMKPPSRARADRLTSFFSVGSLLSSET